MNINRLINKRLNVSGLKSVLYVIKGVMNSNVVVAIRVLLSAFAVKKLKRIVSVEIMI